MAPEDVKAVLTAIEGKAVLVGGQAVAWWAQFYVDRMGAAATAGEIYVSNDVDFLALPKPDVIKPLVDGLAARLREGHASINKNWTSVIAASVTFTASDGTQRGIEVLRDVLGVSKRQRVIDEAILFEAEGQPSVLVMHPVMLLETRVANVVELEKYRNPRGIAQARHAGAVTRAWLTETLDEGGWPAARKWIGRVVSLAEQDLGRKAAAYGIDVLGCIPEDHGALPERFLHDRLRRVRRKLSAASSPAGRRE